jgi:acyl carrier protein
VRTTAAPSPGEQAATPERSFLGELERVPPARREQMLLTLVGEHVARVVGAPSAEAIDPDQPLNELGLDSLMAVELRNRLGAGLGLGRSLPATLVFDYPTMTALSRYLAGQFGPAAPAPATQARPADGVTAIDALSDAQVEEMFARRMGKTS